MSKNSYCIIFISLFSFTVSFSTSTASKTAQEPLTRWRMAKEYVKGKWDQFYGHYFLSKPEYYLKNYEKNPEYQHPQWWLESLRWKAINENKPFQTI